MAIPVFLKKVEVEQVGEMTFEERVAIPVFLKKVEVEQVGEMTFETTSTLVNDGCPSATASKRIVSIDIYKMHR